MGRSRHASIRLVEESLQAPALAVLALEQFVGFGHVGALEVGTVPGEFLADSDGDVAEQHVLRQRPRVIELGAGRGSALARGDPFEVVSHGAWNGLGRRRVSPRVLICSGVPLAAMDSSR